MNRPRIPLAALLALVLAGAGPASAQQVVFDPTNHSANLLQAARALEQINNQVLSLQNQARNLAQLPYSSLSTLKTNLARTASLIQQAQGVALQVEAIDRAFAADYRPGAATSDAQLAAQAQTRWRNSAAAFQDALRLQAGVVAGLPGASAELDALVGQSQDAVGVVQAAQAGNQLIALQSQQLADIAGLLAAQGRAQALSAAEASAGRAAAEIRFRRFMDRRAPQEAADVRMFH